MTHKSGKGRPWGNTELATDPDVEERHLNGLGRLKTNPDQGSVYLGDTIKTLEALAPLADAIRALESKHTNCTNGMEINHAVQQVRVCCDYGILLAQLAIHDKDPGKLQHAFEIIQTHTNTLLGLLVNSKLTESITASHFHNKTKREIDAVIGTAYSALGVISTAKSWLMGQNNKEPLRFYEQAHDLLTGDSYGRIGNAMAAAEQERIRGSGRDTAKWLGRAAIAMCQTAMHDPSNFLPAMRTVISGVADLGSRRAAIIP
jgi:hypothetical protein